MVKTEEKRKGDSEAPEDTAPMARAEGESCEKEFHVGENNFFDMESKRNLPTKALIVSKHECAISWQNFFRCYIDSAAGLQDEARSRQTARIPQATEKISSDWLETMTIDFFQGIAAPTCAWPPALMRSLMGGNSELLAPSPHLKVERPVLWIGDSTMQLENVSKLGGVQKTVREHIIAPALEGIGAKRFMIDGSVLIILLAESAGRIWRKLWPPTSITLGLTPP